LGIFFILAYIVVASAVVIDNWKAALTGVGLLLLFVVIYFVTRKLNTQEEITLDIDRQETP
jgi:Ca2+/Na+ antiporter